MVSEKPDLAKKGSMIRNRKRGVLKKKGPLIGMSAKNARKKRMRKLNGRD